MAQKVDPKVVKTRGYKLQLYADNPEHMRVLGRLRKKFPHDYVGIWHIQRDEQGNEIVKGHGKKHAHVILDFQNPRSWTKLVDDLGADIRFCMPVNVDIDHQGDFVRKKGSVQGGYIYLIHVNAPEKEQYAVTDLWGAVEKIEDAQAAIDAYIGRNTSMSAACVNAILWIQQQTGYISFERFLLWLSTTPYFKAASSAALRRVVDEHNEAVKRKLEADKAKEQFEAKTGIQVSGGYQGVSGYIPPLPLDLDDNFEETIF